MHPSRIIVRSPQVCRVVRLPSCNRPMSLFSTPQYHPRFPASAFPSFSSEIAPLFRLMDEIIPSPRSIDSFLQLQVRPVVHFQPRFDVREIANSYELRGELPGVDSDALYVEFTDAQTLVIRGSTTTEKTNGTPPTREATATAAAAVEAAENIAITDNSDAASTHSVSSYQKPTVEEEEDGTQESSSASAAQTPTESPAFESQQPVADMTMKSPSAGKQEISKAENEHEQYWISERTMGKFQRVFNFPSRINQEGVRASLKNGILNITVPKATAPTSRRINVE